MRGTPKVVLISTSPVTTFVAWESCCTVIIYNSLHNSAVYKKYSIPNVEAFILWLPRLHTLYVNVQAKESSPICKVFHSSGECVNEKAARLGRSTVMEFTLSI